MCTVLYDIALLAVVSGQVEQEAHGTEASMEVENLAHFMHIIALFFINSRGGSNRSMGGGSAPLPPGPWPPHFNH